MADEENSTANNFIWAFALIVITAIIAGALYYSGALTGRKEKQEIDVDISVPASSSTNR